MMLLCNGQEGRLRAPLHNPPQKLGHQCALGLFLLHDLGYNRRVALRLSLEPLLQLRDPLCVPASGYGHLVPKGLEACFK